jgi:hypothetical protein
MDGNQPFSFSTRNRIGRNDPCPCGSRTKYKKCCGAISSIPTLQPSSPIPKEVIEQLRRREADEFIRRQQQGLGHPIVSTTFQGFRILAVGSAIHWSRTWRNFHDFLQHYIKKTLGPDWGNQELKKESNDRHPILQWYSGLFRQSDFSDASTGNHGLMTGAVASYLSLAYYLYLLAHNTKRNQFNIAVQAKLVKELKAIESFPGAHYECLVFSALISAGFEIEFEDQSGKSGKRCECVAVHKLSGKKFSVEAKSIRRLGALGAVNNVTNSSLEQSVRNQLYDALSKKSDHERIVFVDLNLASVDDPVLMASDLDMIATRAEVMTVNKGRLTDPAYVLATNFPNHYHLHQSEPPRILRRLHSLRGLSHEEVEQVFT